MRVMGGYIRQAALGIIILSFAGCVPSAPRMGPIDPNSLLGQDQNTIKSRLGEPELQRQEQAAWFWQYRSADCVADLFFYEETAGGVNRLDHITTRPRAQNQVSHSHSDSAACLGQISAGDQNQ